MSLPQHEEIVKALEKAEDAIRQAEYNLQSDFPIVTANRAYYAGYYCMIALLFTRNVFPKTHQGTHAKFAELFIKSGQFPKYASDIITTLFNTRQQADYDLDADITIDEATSLINKANDFLQLTRQYFEKINSL